MLVCIIINRGSECDAVDIFNQHLSANHFQFHYAKKMLLREYYIVNIFKWYLLLNYSCVPILCVAFYTDYDYSEGMKRNFLPVQSSWCVYTFKYFVIRWTTSIFLCSDGVIDFTQLTAVSEAVE